MLHFFLKWAALTIKNCESNLCTKNRTMIVCQATWAQGIAQDKVLKFADETQFARRRANQQIDPYTDLFLS